MCDTVLTRKYIIYDSKTFVTSLCFKDQRYRQQIKLFQKGHMQNTGGHVRKLKIAMGLKLSPEAVTLQEEHQKNLFPLPLFF